MIVSEGSLIYQKMALGQILRLLSWIDREPFSKTYGCFDRTYWGWKFTDFPGARFQEGVYALAYLFCCTFEHNNLAGNERVLEWARAGLSFWQKNQYRDGSFDEAYPYEHSLAATAFTTFYLGEAFLHLIDYIPAKQQSSLHQTFTRAGDWFCRNDEKHGLLTNHLAAAAAALNVIYRICGVDKYQNRCHYFLQRIYDHQSQEGWYEEYGGADPGYQTHSTFYLARIWRQTQDSTLLESLKQSLAFLKYFIHPNGTLGGEYGSRNTEFYFPAGFEILAPVLPDAALIANFMRASVAKQVSAGLAAMDAYNFLPMLNNYFFAADCATDLNWVSNDLPCQQEFDNEAYFPEAGLFVKSTPNYYSVLGLSKGGILKVYDRATGQLAGSDCGYWAKIDGGQIVSSQSLCRSGYEMLQTNKFSIEANFVQVNQRVQTPWLFMGFRLFTLILGWLPAAAYWLKNLLVHILVRRRQVKPLRLVRQVRFEKDSIFISDKIKVTGKLKVHTLQHGPKFATIHMGSSRYFQFQELEAPSTDEGLDWSRNLQENGKEISIERTFSVSSLGSSGICVVLCAP